MWLKHLPSNGKHRRRATWLSLALVSSTVFVWHTCLFGSTWITPKPHGRSWSSFLTSLFFSKLISLRFGLPKIWVTTGFFREFFTARPEVHDSGSSAGNESSANVSASWQTVALRTILVMRQCDFLFLKIKRNTSYTKKQQHFNNWSGLIPD